MKAPKKKPKARTYKTEFVTLFLVFTLCLNSLGQDKSLHFDHIGIEQGLLNENVTAILQDSKGFMWIGTFDGLYRYDGYSFTKYQFDPSDSNSLSQNFVYTIFEDKARTIWVSTFEGLCKFNRSTEKFTRYKPLPDAKFSNPNISVINEDPNGMIWVGSTSGGLCRFDKQTGKFLDENWGFYDLQGYQGSHHDGINVIYKDHAGTLWIGTTSGLQQLNVTPTKKAGQPSHVSIKKYVNNPADPNSLPGNNVRSIIVDRAGILWVGTNNGLSSFDKKTGLWKRYQNVPGNINSISSNNLAYWIGNGMKEDRDGNLWISTNKGLNKLNKERNVFTSYSHNPNDDHSLSSDYIICLEIDRAGILWVASKAGPSANASWGAKLNKANLNSKAFGVCHADPNNTNSLSDNQVTAIVEDSAGIIWIGTHQGGLNRWDRKINQFTHFRSDSANPKTLRHDAITAMLEDKNGQLWICNGNVLSRLNKQTGEFTHYPSLRDLFIYSITEDQEGLLWLGTGNGIRSFNKKTGEFAYWDYDSKNPDGLSDNTVVSIFADSKDNIWIGHGSKATDKYSKKTNRFNSYKHAPHDSFSISSNIIYSFYEDTKGNLWLGSWAGGLSYFDYNKETFKTFTDKDGLASTTVFSIEEDNNGHLWLGTRNGLSRFDPVTKTFKNYDYTDGLQGNIFAAGPRERGAHYKGRDGTLYFGGSNGFSFFNPLGLKTDSQRAPIVITQFKIFDSLIKGVSELDKIVLDYNQNYFSFEFSSLSFYNPAKNQFAYKLEGVDKDWVYSGSRHYVSYTNIDPGKYTFRVIGTNNDGVWNEKGAYISIIVKPPWWRTWLAYVLYAVVFSLLLTFVVKWRERTLKNEKELLEKKVNLRTSELQTEKEKVEGTLAQVKELQKQLVQIEKINERLRISKDLHDDIGGTLSSISIYSQAAIQRTESGNITDSKDILQKIGEASRSVLRELNEAVWLINPRNDNLQKTIHRITNYALPLCRTNNICFEIKTSDSLENLDLSVEKRKVLYLISKEAINNSLKYAAAKNLAIHFEKNCNFLHVSIKDDGVGFTTNSPSAGNGLKNMIQRANDVDWKIELSSEMQKGTKIILEIPLTNIGE